MATDTQRVIVPETVDKVLKITTTRMTREAVPCNAKLWRVQQPWKAIKLEPHLYKMFNIGNDPNFFDEDHRYRRAAHAITDERVRAAMKKGRSQALTETIAYMRRLDGVRHGPLEF